MASDDNRKRSRTLSKPQSKNGCFTCRARRVKCDERKPNCERCMLSRRQCEGYSSQSTSRPPQTQSHTVAQVFCRDSITCTVSATTEFPLLVNVLNGFGNRCEQERLARLGCSILSDDTSHGLGSGTMIWDRLLPQLSYAIPSVNAAAAALGAISEVYLSPAKVAPESKRRAAIQYGIALRSLQGEVTSQVYGPIPVLMSCVLMAFAELLRHRQSKALLHFQAALQILSSRQRSPSPSIILESKRQLGADPKGGSEPDIDDNLSLMFMTLDIQKSSYALGSPPEMAPFDERSRAKISASIDAAEAQLVRLIHSGYHFTAKASKSKYCAKDMIPSDLVIEQGRHIANLSGWLRDYSHGPLLRDRISSDSPPGNRYYHALTLRTQCLSMLIYVSTILKPHETSYDSYSPQFQRIIRDAAVVLAQDSKAVSGLGRFGSQPGIMAPLFFAALKYRHGSWRRQAISLLQRCGKDGPWDGKLHAAIINRVVQIEEGQRPSATTGGSIPEEIPESNRIHGCGTDGEADSDEAPHATAVMFSRCLDVEKMLSTSESWADKSNWDIWLEAVEF